MFVPVVFLILSSLVLAGALLWGFRPRHTHLLEELEIQVRKYRHELDQLHKERDTISEESRKFKDELQLISEVARSLGASTHLGETTQIFRSMVRRSRIPYQSCVLFLVTADGSLEVGTTDTSSPHPMDPHSPILLQALKEQRASILEALSEGQVFPEEQSVMLVPLRVRNENVGLVYLGSLKAHTHKHEHLEKAKTLASLAAPSIKTAQLFGKQQVVLDSEREVRAAVEAKNRQLDGLQKLSAAIGTSLRLVDTLRAVGDSLLNMIRPAQSVVFLGRGEDGMLKVDYSNGPYTDYLESLALRADDGIFGRASHFSEAMVENSPGLIHNEASGIVSALRAEGQLLGFLYVGAVQAGSLTEEHRQLVTTVAYQTALAINNARLYERTQQMATTDGLTGLYLHRYFQVRLAEEITRAERNQTSLCLVMVDTDHFKTYNDTLGHPAGDALLKEIAILLQDKVRHGDVVCRYGGDEFAIILRDIPKDEAARTSERIRETFQLRFATNAVQVTASIGLACFPTDARTKADLARVADEALYVSKRGGRNRVTVAPALS